MTLKLTLSPELEHRLRDEASRRGLPAELVAIQLLEERLPQGENSTHKHRDPRNLQDLFAAAERATEPEGDYDLLKALDENRQGERPLFPPDLKGISW